MTLGVSTYGQALSGKFQQAAIAGNYSEAFKVAMDMSLVDGLCSCLELAKKNRQAFDALAAQANEKIKPPYCVRVVKDGFIPVDSYVGVGADIDYHFTRIFLLRAREERKQLTLSLWGNPDVNAQSKLFFPELVRNTNNRRERIRAIAEKHVGLKTDDPREVALFSLGGLYDFKGAKAGTKPQVGTTCILFARSVLHAAGCNMISPETFRVYCAVPKGFRDLNLSKHAFVPASKYDEGMRPQVGDMFHIAGGNFKNKEGKDSGIGSTHVGIVIEVAENIWRTVEGGASDHVTRRGERKLINVKSSYGKWAFSDDNTSAGVRPLQGWFDISLIDQKQWMAGS